MSPALHDSRLYAVQEGDLWRRDIVNYEAPRQRNEVTSHAQIMLTVEHIVLHGEF